MAVLWDAVLAREVAHELNTRLAGTRVRAYHVDAERRRLTLFADEACLEWRLHPLEGHVRLLEPREPFEAARSLNGTIRSVSAGVDERRVWFDVIKKRGTMRKLALQVLLATNRRNALIVNTLGVIDDVMLPGPGLAQGRPYEPRASDRIGSDGSLSREAWDAHHAGAPTASSLMQLAWVSRLNVAWLLEADDAYDAWGSLAGLRPPVPTVFRTRRGSMVYPVPLTTESVEHLPSLLAGLEHVAADLSAAVDPEVSRRLDEAIARAERTVRSLERELERSPDPATIRADADLLLARLHEIPRGRAEITLEGFAGEEVRLQLDPTLSPRENADSLYDQAGRATRARSRLPERIEEAKQRLKTLREARDSAEQGGTLDPVALALPAPKPRQGTAADGPALPYRPYRSRGGLEIRVGRGSKSNDELTFKHARPNDVWLHARDIAGAHVVLRWDRDDAPPARDLEDAALLAALHSKARHSSLVPVDWTRRKHVRKPRKAPAGTVIPAHVKTVFVEPDEDRAEAMAIKDASS